MGFPGTWLEHPSKPVQTHLFPAKLTHQNLASDPKRFSLRPNSHRSDEATLRQDLGAFSGLSLLAAGKRLVSGAAEEKCHLALGEVSPFSHSFQGSETFQETLRKGDPPKMVSFYLFQSFQGSETFQETQGKRPSVFEKNDG